MGSLIYVVPVGCFRSRTRHVTIRVGRCFSTEGRVGGARSAKPGKPRKDATDQWINKITRKSLGYIRYIYMCVCAYHPILIDYIDGILMGYKWKYHGISISGCEYIGLYIHYIGAHSGK